MKKKKIVCTILFNIYMYKKKFLNQFICKLWRFSINVDFKITVSKFYGFWS